MQGKAPAGRLRYLDSIRGLAALSVAVLFHYPHFSSDQQNSPYPMSAAPFFHVPGLHQLYGTGYVCVDMFFILSGFVFSHVYANDVASRRVGAWTFFSRRLSRLYPIHLLTMLLALALAMWFYAEAGRYPVYTDYTPLALIKNLLLVHYGLFSDEFSFNGPAWSLSIEAMLYVVFFVLARGRMRLRWTLAALVIGLALTAVDPVAISGFNPAWRDVGRGVVGFFLGVVLQHHGQNRPLAFLLLLTGLAILCRAVPLLHPMRTFAAVWVGFSLTLLAMQRYPLLQRPLLWQPFLILGDISLAIYLIHFPVQIAILIAFRFMNATIPYPAPAFLCIYTGLVLVPATLLHYAFERPVQDWLRRVLSSRAGRATAGNEIADQTRTFG